MASLIVQEKIPARNVEGAFEMVLTIMQALQYAGYKLPFLTHEMFEKEQNNILSLYRLLTNCEKDVLEAVIKSYKEKYMFTHLWGEATKRGILKHHKGELTLLVLHSLCALIEKKMYR